MANEFKIKKGLIVTGASGGTVVDIQGSQGQLFSVTDDLSGSIFAVSDISGVPILDVNSSGLSTFAGNVDIDGGTLNVGSSNQVNIVASGFSLFPSLKVNNNGYLGSASVPTQIQLLSSGNTIFAKDLLLRGTYNPYAQANRGNITLNGSNTNIIAFTNNTVAKGYIYHNGTDLEILNVGTGILKFATSNAERMRITSSGNVGIGATSPGAKLHVNSENSQGTLIISRGGDNLAATNNVGSITFPADYDGTPTNYAQIKAYANALSAVRGSLDFNVKSTSGNLLTGMTVYGTSAGANVGIGTTSPGAKLHVQGAVTIKGSGTGTSGSLAIQDDYDGENHLANIGWIRSSGGVYLSYGLKQEDSAEWKSTYANFSGERTYAKLDNNEFSMAHAPAQDTAVGTAVTDLTERFKFYLNTGVLQLNSYSAGILSTNSSGTVGLASSGDLPGGPYLPLSAGSSYPLTDTLYIKPSGNPTNTMLISARANDTYGNIQFTNAAETANWTQLRSTSTQFTINNANVGINVTSPGVKLQLVSADEQLTNFSSSVADQLAYSQINASSSTSGVITAAAALELVGKANASGHGRHAWIGAEGTPNTNTKTKLKFKIRGETANGYDWAGAAEAPTIMTLEGDGNVGIGTTSPDAKLFIEYPDATTNTVLRTKLDAAYSMGISNDLVSTYVSKLRLGRVNASTAVSNMEFVYDIQGTEYGSIKRNYTASSLKFERGTTLDMIINGSGNVGIGATSPGTKLHVGSRGTAAAPVAPYNDGLMFDFANDSYPYLRHSSIISQSSDYTEAVIDFYTKAQGASGSFSSATKKMTIRGDGNVGIGA